MPENGWLAAVREVLEPLRRKHHVGSRDPDDWCDGIFEGVPDRHGNIRETGCTCGAREHNAKVDEIVGQIAKGAAAAVNSALFGTVPRPEWSRASALAAFRESSR